MEIDDSRGDPEDVQVVDYYLKYDYEAMAFACRTWGKAQGAQNIATGSINVNIDLSSKIYNLPGESRSGFGDEHSGQFNANIQYLKPFYNKLLEEFVIPHNL